MITNGMFVEFEVPYFEGTLRYFGKVVAIKNGIAEIKARGIDYNDPDREFLTTTYLSVEMLKVTDNQVNINAIKELLGETTIPEEFDYKIDGNYFAVDSRRRYGKTTFTWCSIWDGSGWLSLGDPFPSINPAKKMLSRAGKVALGEILSVNYKEVYPNTDLPDLEGETYKAGDLVYDSEHNAVGVVLGCINDREGVLRLDSDGVVSQKHLRFATFEDIKREGTFVGKGLYEQIKKEYGQQEKNNPQN